MRTTGGAVAILLSPRTAVEAERRKKGMRRRTRRARAKARLAPVRSLSQCADRNGCNANGSASNLTQMTDSPLPLSAFLSSKRPELARSPSCAPPSPVSGRPPSNLEWLEEGSSAATKHPSPSITLAELDSHIRLLHLPHLRLALTSPSAFGTAASFSLPFPATPPLLQKAQAFSIDCFRSASAMRLEKAAV